MPPKIEFCNNPKCVMHISISSDLIRENRCRINTHQGIKLVQRHEYTFDLHQPIFLCDACHSAVQLINKQTMFNIIRH